MSQSQTQASLEVQPPLKDKLSLVLRLRDLIAQTIKENDLKPGDRLPTEADLTKRYGVSRPVVREAFKLLEQDNLIYVKHGLGRFVSAMASVHVERPITVFESYTDMTQRQGYESKCVVLSVKVEQPMPEVSEALQTSEDVVRLERIRLNQSEVIMYGIDYFPRRFIPGSIDSVDWNQSLLNMLGQYGQRPVMSSATVSAQPLPKNVVKANKLEDFGPALVITEVAFTEQGQPALMARNYHRGNYFSFSFVRN